MGWRTVEKQLGKVQIIYLGSRKNRTSKFADIVLPGVTVFEKHGTYINQQFRIQKFESTIPPPNPLADNRVSLVKILKWLLPENDSSSCEINSLWNERSASFKALKGIHSSKLPEFGIMLNQENWEKKDSLKVNSFTIVTPIFENNRLYNLLIGFSIALSG